ncbi:hypothetical protein D3C75_891820 [compost metagenome]
MDKAQETVRVTAMPNSTIPITTMAVARERRPLAAPAAINREDRRISVGQRPLQGTKLLVRIASIRSRGDSIIRVDIIAAALQPKPMDMVRACLPWPPDFLKRRSMLKATRGR